MNLPALAALLAVFAVLLWRRASLFTWCLAWLVGFYVALRFGFRTPIPASVITIYMGIAILSLAAYVTSSRERLAQVTDPMVRLMTERRLLPGLVAVLVGLPVLAAANVYLRMSVPLEAPLFSRTVHPASPAEVTVHGRAVNLDEEENPYRALESSDPEAFRRHVTNGRRVYYQNCFYCHGDDMRGTGMFVHGLNPIPTNFGDQGTIAMLRETFLFWRIAKGGPGMPEEGGPWDSAMPAWEKFLTEEEMWDTILFLYDFTGQRARAKEEIHH